MIQFRVLFDQGSECCFVSERVIKKLRPQCEKIDALIYGVGGNSIGATRQMTHLTLIPTKNNCLPVRIQALVLVHLTAYTPPIKPDWLDGTRLSRLSLVESDPFNTQPIDLILGADIVGSCLLEGIEQRAFGALTAQSTIFGWILSGSIELRDKDIVPVSTIAMAHSCSTSDTVQAELRQFWEIEE